MGRFAVVTNGLGIKNREVQSLLANLSLGMSALMLFGNAAIVIHGFA